MAMERNNTTFDSGMVAPLTEDLLAAKTVAHSVILVMSLFGNSLVILAVGMFPHMRSIPNLFLAHLAICDILTPLSNIPFDLVYQHNSYIWFFGKQMCSILWPFSTLFTNCSVLTLIAISIDRYRVLTNPMDPSKRLTPLKCKIIFAVIYFIGILSIIPYSLVLKVVDNDCVEVWNIPLMWQKVYTVFLFLLQYGLPLPTLIFVYIRLGLYLYRQEAMTKKINQTKKSSESRRRQEGQKWKRIRIFLAVVIVFATFMLPNQILWLWIDFGGRELKSFQKEIFLFNTFTYANSVCNPWIYAVLSRQFSDAFLRIFEQCCMKKRMRKTSVLRSSIGGTSNSISELPNRKSSLNGENFANCCWAIRAYCWKSADGRESLNQRNNKQFGNSHETLYNAGDITSPDHLKSMKVINCDSSFRGDEIIDPRNLIHNFQLHTIEISGNSNRSSQNYGTAKNGNRVITEVRAGDSLKSEEETVSCLEKRQQKPLSKISDKHFNPRHSCGSKSDIQRQNDTYASNTTIKDIVDLYIDFCPSNKETLEKETNSVHTFPLTDEQNFKFEELVQLRETSL